MKYIDSDKSKELQALFAAQLLAEDLKHPKGKYLFPFLFRFNTLPMEKSHCSLQTIHMLLFSNPPSFWCYGFWC